MVSKTLSTKTRPRKVQAFFKNGIKKSEGSLNPVNRKSVGEWRYYNEFGRITSTGYFDALGRKTGVWLSYDWHLGDVYSTKFSAGKAGAITFVKKITNILPKNLPDAIHQIMHLASVK